ncbi:5-oxoprolinase/urea amidolyase family protein [Klebsiella sp. BIGb0407]|uniref:5-oxoprolinase subunit B/C family protein n=1 Tax=Klebsiella sp. BIGb0407 TaxID=2940603 RepID=UPI0021675C67|nr:5-oxoprolinase/urea amidolyase family protein [Klebsiella sp. BIGb0407]MCS3431815.1 KipI family sensor histidine kinase inhibitor [Klebsiella sp. BIGb0407]
MRFIPVNLTHFLVELSSLEETLALFDSLTDTLPSGIDEIIPAARTLLIRFQPLQTNMQRLATDIALRPKVSVSRPRGQTIIIPVHYQGEDLGTLADLSGLTVLQVIQHHQESVWKVAFTGFAPGFAYLTSPDWKWQIPRRSTPRTRIPAGSVAVAGIFSGIYPQASPGGWQLLGHTERPMWDLNQTSPALLTPGAQVQFIPHENGKTISLPARAPSVPHISEKDASLTILATGLQTLWQDEGRAGKASMGLSASGAMDKQALYSANRIVGNPREACCLEVTQGGLRIRANKDLVLAVTGAPCLLTLTTADGQDFLLAGYRPLNLAAGDQLALGTPPRGLRSYLAVRGGFVVPSVLGSCSWDSLAQTGPQPLCSGDAIQTGSHVSFSAVLLDEQPANILPAAGETVTLDIMPGPRTDWFTPESATLLTTQCWQVTPQSNRIGLRLTGMEPLTRSRTEELPSEGTCSGAIQVPANGQPVLFLRDNPVTGGYPVIAVVADYHLDLAGQIPPGVFIRFRVVS